jgi:hypothetical protein
MVDNRFSALRPRTRQDEDTHDQPIGWSGVDPIALRTQDPIRTFETPLVFFPQDIVIPVSSQISVPLPQRCYQIAFINLTPGVWASFNQGGARTIKDGFIYNGEFSTLDITTDAAGTCTLQLACY